MTHTCRASSLHDISLQTNQGGSLLQVLTEWVAELRTVLHLSSPDKMLSERLGTSAGRYTGSYQIPVGSGEDD